MTNNSHTHERRFNGEPDRLRRPERIALLEIDRVVTLSLEGLIVKSVLDIGAGSGLFLEAFLKRGVEVAGIDPNNELLEAAKNFVPTAHLVKAVAENIPFADKFFDLAFLAHVLHETDDPLKALNEAKRIGRKRVVVLEWPYIEEEEGPPLEHRLKPEVIEELTRDVGFLERERIKLNHMDLYRLTVL